MKSPIMLVCAMLTAMSMSVLAAEQAAAGAKGGGNDQVQAGRGKHAKLTDEQRAEMVNKRLEQIKAKDEALYKELVALKEKDPEAFKAKMRELGKAEHEAMMNKHLENIKAKDEALYKELIALKEKDPEAFRAKMRELGKAQGKGKGRGKAKGAADAGK